MIRLKLIRDGRDGAGICPGAVARCGQAISGLTMMAAVVRLSSIAFSHFRSEMTKGDALSRNTKCVFATLPLVGIMVAGLVFTPSALAATGAGATIHNVTTVSYDGFAATTSVDVTVSTLAAAPQISVDSTAQTVVAGGTATYNYTIVNNSNGLDSFSVTAASVDAGMTGPPGLDLNSSGTPSTSFTLGASIASVASDASGNIYIPAGSEAGLGVGDEIAINGVGVYTIATLTPGTPASTVGAITTPEAPTRLTATPVGASPAIGAGTVAVGTQLGERAAFPLVATANTPSVVGVDGTHTVNLSGTTTATDAGGAVVSYATSAGSANETVTTVTSASVTLIKEVRNVTTGTGFASSGGTLQSGDILEYRITATPIPGGGNLANSQIVDEVPNNTTYVPGSTTLNGAPVPDGAGSTLPTTFANGGLQINSPTGAAGVLVDGESAVLIFRVTVD